MLSEQRFSSLRKFKLCIYKKINFFGAADVKSKKGTILAGELQFYQLQKRRQRKTQARTGFEPRPPITCLFTFIGRPIASEYLIQNPLTSSAYNKTVENILLSKRKQFFCATYQYEFETK